MVYSAVSQAVSFLLNNLTKENVEQQADILRQLVANNAQDTRDWFAHYLVRRIAAADARALDVFAQLVEEMHSDALWELIVEETVCHAKQLIAGLCSIPVGRPQRLLRNLGVFLGLLTIASDRPIVLDTLNLKRSLVDAISEGEEKLAKVLPFLVHALKASAKSTIFRPHCSWLAPIFRLLEQLQNQPDLKMVFSLEIQSLFMEISENAGPSLVDDADPPRPSSQCNRPVETDSLQPHLPIPAPTSSFPGQIPYPHHIYGNVHGSEGSLPNPLFHAYYSDEPPSPNEMFPTQPYPAMEAPPPPPQTLYSSGSAMYSAVYSPYPINASCRTASYAFSDQPLPPTVPTHHHHQQQPQPYSSEMSRHGAVVVAQQPTVQFRATAPYFTPQRTVSFSKEQKFVWDAIQKLNFSCSQVFQLINSSREFVVEGVPSFLAEVERIVEQILFRLSDSIRGSAIAILYRDLVLLEDPVLLATAFRSTFRSMLYAMYQPRSAVEVIHSTYVEFVCEAVERALRQSPIQQQMSAMRSVIKQAGQDFVQSNISMVSELVIAILERYANDWAEQELERMLYERSVTLRTNAPRPEMARFIGQPSSMHILNAALPPKLRRHVLLEAKAAMVCDYFEPIAKDLQSHLSHLFAHYDPSRATAGAEAQDFAAFAQPAKPPPVLPKNAHRPDPDQPIQRALPDLTSPSSSTTAGELPSPTDALSEEEVKTQRSELTAREPETEAREEAEEASEGTTLEEQTLLLEHSVPVLFREWCVALRTGVPIDTEVYDIILKRFCDAGVLASPFSVVRFVYICMQICIDLAGTFQNKVDNARACTSASRQIYNHVNAFVSVVNRLADQEHLDDRRLEFVQRVLGTTIKITVDYFSSERAEPILPMQRSVFYYCLQALIVTQLRSGTHCASHMLEFLCHALHLLNPLQLPRFEQLYVLLIAQPSLLAALGEVGLLSSTKTGATLFIQLHMPLVQVLARGLHGGGWAHGDGRALRSVYASNAQIFRLLHRQYPHVLAHFHFSYLDQLPRLCLHLRNLVLDATPGQRIQYEATKTLQEYCLLPSMCSNPEIHDEFLTVVTPEIRDLVAQYLRDPANVHPLNRVCDQLRSPDSQFDQRRTNMLVLFFGVHGVNSIFEAGRPIDKTSVEETNEANALRYLVISSCPQGWFLLFTAMVDQLRYANSHTAFFANALLYLFESAHSDQVREVFSRVLLERVLANQPHPLGLKLVLAELLRNREPNGLAAMEFLHCSPVVEGVLLSVASYLEVEITNEQRELYFSFHRPPHKPQPAAPKPPTEPEANNNNNSNNNNNVSKKPPTAEIVATPAKIQAKRGRTQRKPHAKVG